MWPSLEVVESRKREQVERELEELAQQMSAVREDMAMMRAELLKELEFLRTDVEANPTDCSVFWK